VAQPAVRGVRRYPAKALPPVPSNEEAPYLIQEAMLVGLHAKYKDPQLHWSSYTSRLGTEEVEHPASWC